MVTATPLLFERDGDLRVLARSLDDATEGRGRVVIVTGEAGLGKTELVTTFLASVPLTRRAIGRCDPLTTPRALGPFLDIARTLGAAAAAGRDELFGVLLDAVAGGPGPTVVVVEDTHWADRASIELLSMLGRRAPELPLLLVVTLRDDDVPAEHALRFAIGDLVTSSATSYRALQPLSLDGVRALAGSSGLDPTELHRRTGGNPFHITEVLAAPGEVVPPSVRMAVLARMATLHPAARAVVDAVSIVPGGTERWLLDAVLAPRPGDVQRCLDRGVLVGRDDGYAFRHELARLAIEGQLGDVARRDLHRRALDALAARDGVDPGRLAHHAAGTGDEEALARASAAAAADALARGAVHEAARHGQVALQHEPALGGDAAATVRMHLADALGQLGSGAEAVDVARAAAAHWRAVGDAGRESAALHVLGTVAGGAADMTTALDAMARIHELLAELPPGPAHATAYVRQASILMLDRDRDGAVAWAERAIDLATRLGDEELRGRALVTAGIADVLDGRFDGLDRIRAAIDLGRRRDLPGVVALGLMQIGSGCGELRRYDLAVPALEEGVAWCEAHHLEAFRRYAEAWLGRCRLDLGDWDAAEGHARAVLAGARGPSIETFVALNTLGRLRARRGDDDVWPALDAALPIARATGHLQRLWPVAVSRAEAGWLDGAIEPHVALLEEQLVVAERCRHDVAAAELRHWLAMAGGPPAPPFAPAACPYEVAAARAATGDTAALVEALTTFTRLGARPMAARVAAELSRRGVAVAGASPHGRPHGLSNRELEVLRLVVAGFSNPEIASALYISRKTAEHHVSAILMKLGARTRAEAAATAVRQGIAVDG